MRDPGGSFGATRFGQRMSLKGREHQFVPGVSRRYRDLAWSLEALPAECPVVTPANLRSGDGFSGYKA